MKRRTKILCSIGVIGLVGAVGVTGAHAQLNFKTTQVVQFTFDSSLSLNVSGDLLVNNMTAGNAADSNEITIAVDTNSFSGYYLTATAGASNTDTDLVNTTNSSYLFSSLATDSSVANMANADDNTWGYNFKVGSGNYGNYSGLPLDGGDDGETGAVLINSTTPADSKTVTFKIGAKAASNQPAGVYTNTINFFAVTLPLSDSTTINDLEYMQEFATLTPGKKSTILASMNQNQQYQLKDSRDEKTYYIAKLADGNVWMTQNLDLDIDSNTTYDSTNTDIKTIWTPSSSTHITSDTSWTFSNTTPESYDPGLICWNGSIRSNTATTECTQTDSSHYQIGNYYNWTSAVAMNNSSSYTTSGTDLDQSICPAGWRLPTYDGNKSYANLVTGLSLTSGISGTIQSSPVYFVYSGYWSNTGTIEGVGNNSVYWSSVVRSNNNAYSMYFDANGGLYPQSSTEAREFGNPVRCVLR